MRLAANFAQHFRLDFTVHAHRHSHAKNINGADIQPLPVAAAVVSHKGLTWRRADKVRPHTLRQAPRIDDPQRNSRVIFPSSASTPHVDRPIPAHPHLAHHHLDAGPVRRERRPSTRRAAQHAVHRMGRESRVRAHD
jgi:hypothetical protein